MTDSAAPAGGRPINTPGIAGATTGTSDGVPADGVPSDPGITTTRAPEPMGVQMWTPATTVGIGGRGGAMARNGGGTARAGAFIGVHDANTNCRYAKPRTGSAE